MKPLLLPHRLFAVITCIAVLLIFTTIRPGASGSSTTQAREQPNAVTTPTELWVDARRGKDTNDGSRNRPFASLSAALQALPDPLTKSVTIEIAPGVYRTTGGHDMPNDCLELMRRMTPGEVVRIIGVAGRNGSLPTFAWEGGRAMVDVREGDWWIENVQIGAGTRRQRRGVMVAGTAHATLKDATFRTRSLSDAAIYASDGGKVSLRGTIRINEHLHDKADDETFSGIIATNHGLVRFVERQGASLDIGNGSLASSYYGCIRLGCETARITSWGDQSNCMAINNGGRIDLHNTTTTLCAKQERNTPVGLEHDGHILAEGAKLIIIGKNKTAIALQKASTLTCNDVDLQGEFERDLWASSGSMFAGRFLCDVGKVHATTSASINIEKINGTLTGPVVAEHGGQVSLPDRNHFSKAE